MNPVEIYDHVRIAFNELAEIRGQLDGVPIKSDTAFALGEALGVVMKAKSLVGRDIDDAKKERVSDEAH